MLNELDTHDIKIISDILETSLPHITSNVELHEPVLPRITSNVDLHEPSSSKVFITGGDILNISDINDPEVIKYFNTKKKNTKSK